MGCKAGRYHLALMRLLGPYLYLYMAFSRCREIILEVKLVFPHCRLTGETQGFLGFPQATGLHICSFLVL
jgi:hypothetical protein